MNDQELRRRFDALRRAEQSAASPFRLAASPRRRVAASTRRWRWWRLAAAAALVVLFGAPFAVRRWWPPQPSPSLTTWKAPTDFLLDTPGNELLRSVPQIGPAAVADSLKGVPQ